MVACNDNNPCTENDVQSVLDSDGTICIPCAGTPINCNNGSTSVVSCDDGNISTINDQQTILDCDGSICIPCTGTPVDCSNGPTTSVSCDDRNPCTINDAKIILTIDNSVCVPCQGTLIEIADPQIEDQLICQNESIPTLVVTNPNIGASFLWYDRDPSFGVSPILVSDTSIFKPNLNNNLAGIFNFWVIQKIGSCESIPVSFSIKIEPAPLVDAGIDIDFDCKAGEVRLNGIVPLDEFEIRWDGPDTTMQTEIINPIVTIPGIYTLQIFDPANECLGVDTVTVLPPAGIFANNDHHDLFEGEIYQINILENDSLGNYEEFMVRTFDLTSGNILVNDENIVFYTPEDLRTNRTESFSYEVCVLDCPEVCAQAEVTIDLSTKSIYIPNAFSPNADGQNDFFYVSGDPNTIKGIQKFAVFNRWGAQIFGKENTSINDPQLGWNGFFKGERASQNVYIYFVEVEFKDGSLVIFSGDISLFHN